MRATQEELDFNVSPGEKKKLKQQNLNQSLDFIIKQFSITKRESSMY